MGDRFQLTPISYVVFKRGNEVLLQLRQGTGYMDGHWANAAAGHVESNESALDAEAREVYEELGIAVNTTDLHPLVVMHRNQGSGQTDHGRVDFFFECTSWESEPQLMEPHKAGDLRWFHLDSLPSAMVPHERHVLERLRSGMPPIISLGFSAP
jgi:8-oxo-dGTP diphosphatase